MGKRLIIPYKGVMLMSKHKKNHSLPDTQYEGKDNVYMDIDRIINEGLSGGSVHGRADFANIEEAREFSEEEPPQSAE